MDALKILMVDDEERMRKLVKDFLTNKGPKRPSRTPPPRTSS